MSIFVVSDLRRWFAQNGFPKVAVRMHRLEPMVFHVYLPRRLQKWDYDFLVAQLNESVCIGFDVRVHCGFVRWLWYGYVEGGF